MARSHQIYGFTDEIQIVLMLCYQCVRNVSAKISVNNHTFTHIIQFYTENGIKLSGGREERERVKGGAN